jgi:TRAP-type C4-dicarboxylate transport system substrate-binding protein
VRKKQCDAVVVGCGHGGAMAGKFAALGGVATLILEDKKQLGYPNPDPMTIIHGRSELEEVTEEEVEPATIYSKAEGCALAIEMKELRFKKGGKMKRGLWKKIMVKATILLAVSLVLTGMPAPAPAATTAKPMVLGYESFLPPAEPGFPVLQKFMKGLEDATDGAVKVEFRMAGVMGKPTETYNRVIGGISSIGHVAPHYILGVFPIWGIFHQPIRFPSAEVLTKSMLEMYKKGYFDKEFGDVKIISLRNVGPYTLNSPYKIATLEDFKGKKLRSPSEGFVKVGKALGGVPVTMPVSEVYLALQKGIVDADWDIPDGVFVYKYHEVSKYLMNTSFSTTTHIIAMNKDAWKRLPQAGRNYIDKNWEGFSLDLSRAYDASNRKGMEFFASRPGREVVTIAPAEWEKIDKRITPIWHDWIADAEAKKLPAKKAATELYRILRNLGVEKPFVGYTP